jgi:transposase-like protein
MPICLVQAMGMSGIWKSQVSRLCAEIDDQVKAFLARPIEGDWPFLWIDAIHVKVRQNGRIVPVAVIVAVGVNSDGRREVLGMDIVPPKPSGWRSCKLARRGLRGIQSRRQTHSHGIGRRRWLWEVLTSQDLVSRVEASFPAV